MKNLSLRSVTLVVALCFLVVGMASASSISTLRPLPSNTNQPHSNALTVTNVPFPTAGDSYCSATNGCGTIPAGGQTASQWTAGDFVISSIFVLPTTSVTDITANWNYQDFLGGGNTETWFAFVNGVAVAMATLPDDGFKGDILNVSGTVNFAGIAPVAGGYQVELVLQNTVPFGGGSAAWLDGGITGLSFNSSTTPEPGSMILFGSGVVGLAGLLRRKLSL
jgi:PEP-CTERM motif